ncbi:hypothetical protein EMIT0P265_80144 [Pseudomonas zeae]
MSKSPCGSEPARESGTSGNTILNVMTLSRAGSLPQKQGCIHPLNVDHHGNKLQKPSLADYG